MFTSYSKMTGLRSAKYLVVMVRVISCKIKVIKMTGLRSAKYVVVMVRVISCKIKVIKMHTAWQIFDISDIHTPCRDC